jgi:hypothetical protein
MAGQQTGDIGATQRVLEELLNDGQITETDYQRAAETQAGAAWERAEYLARLDDTERRQSGPDFAMMLLRPHAPIVWAYNLSRGEPAMTEPLLPISRSIRAVGGLLGIDTNRVPFLSIGGKIREHLGLPAFSEWDEYRDERMLTNMVASGEISIREMYTALEEGEGNPNWEEGHRRALQEFGVGAMGSTLGMPVRAYPPGERQLRELREQYEGAWRAYEGGDDTALERFYDRHPEYEARLALFKSPEERLNRFLVDELWDKYNSLTSLERREVRDQFGEVFDRNFLNKETRATDSIPAEQLASWLAALGGETPGALGEDARPIVFAEPEVAHIAEAFFQTRNQKYPNWFDLQDEYFDLSKGTARSQYRRNHPELAEYWSWRNDFMQRNPDTIPYLSDTFEPNYGSEEELRAAEAAQPDFTFQEWGALFAGGTYGPSMNVMIDDWIQTGIMDRGLRSALEDTAEDLGISFEELRARLMSSSEELQPAFR